MRGPALFDAQDEIDRRREQLINEIEGEAAIASRPGNTVQRAMEFSMTSNRIACDTALIQRGLRNPSRMMPSS
jgi:hypothetical protein